MNSTEVSSLAAHNTLGALSKLLLMLADFSEFIEDLPDVPALSKKKYMKRREQAKLHAP
jgi:hypothetical protein